MNWLILALWIATSLAARRYLTWWWEVDTCDMGERGRNDFLRGQAPIIVLMALAWPVAIPALWVANGFWPRHFRLWKRLRGNG